MKRVLLVLLVFLLVGCTNPIEKMIDDAKNKVKEEMKNVSDIGVDKIKKSVKYIINNHSKKVDNDFIYNTLIIRTITSSSNFKDNKIKIMADKAYEYILKQSDENKDALEKIINSIDDNIDKEIDSFYQIYKNSVVVNTYFSKAKAKLIKMKNTLNFINKDSIKNEINCIIKNYKNYYRDEEVIEKITYSVMYIEYIANNYKIDNNVTKLVSYLKKYMQENDSKYLDSFNAIISDVKGNIDNYIQEMMDIVNK